MSASESPNSARGTNPINYNLRRYGLADTDSAQSPASAITTADVQVETETRPTDNITETNNAAPEADPGANNAPEVEPETDANTTGAGDELAPTQNSVDNVPETNNIPEVNPAPEADTETNASTARADDGQAPTQSNVTGNQVLYPMAMLMDKFSGDGRVHPKHWLARFENLAEFQGYSDRQRLSGFKLHMTGEAAHWLTTLSAGQQSSMESLTNAFLERFQKKVSDWYPENVKQRPGESIADYIVRIQTLGTASVTVPELMQIRGATEGLLPEIRRSVLEKDPQTWQDFRTCAENAIRTNKIMQNSTANACVASADSNEPLNQVLVAITGMMHELKNAQQQTTMQNTPPAGRRRPQHQQYQRTQRQPPMQQPQWDQQQSGYYEQPRYNYRPREQYRQSPEQHRMPQQQYQQPERRPARENRVPPMYPGQCEGCGEYCPSRDVCRFRNTRCHDCHNLGHISRLCRMGERSRMYKQ